MPFKDRTGIKYGKLTALKYLGKSMWLCQCDCGKQVKVYGGHLETGHTKSCGCFRPPRINLLGQKFNRLTPIEWQGKGKWLCQCDCGNQVAVETNNLRTGNTQSCGCLQKERTSQTAFKSLIGQRFGKLAVVERVENNRLNHVCYKCQCDCGGITVVDVANLRNGNTSSCGCIKSKGEMLVQQWLQAHNIKYIPQYSHDKIILESGRRPFFDFAIFDDKDNLICFIEYDGKQHFEYSGNGWDNKDNFEATQNRDRQKDEWCKKLNIPLYRIAYNQDISMVLKGIAKDLAAEPDMEEAQDLIEEEEYVNS